MTITASEPKQAAQATGGILWIARMMYATNIRLRELEFAKRLCKRAPIFLLDRHEAVGPQENGLAAKIRLRWRLRSGGLSVLERGPITRFRMPVTAATGPVLNRMAARKNEARVLAAMREFGCDKVFHASQFYFLPPEQRGYRYHFDLVDNFFGEWGDGTVGASRKAFLRDSMRRADTLSAVSLSLCERLEKFTGRPAIYLPNGADLESIARWPRERGADLRTKLGLDNRRVVAFIGNHSVHASGLPLVLKAWREAFKANPGLALLIVGPGADRHAQGLTTDDGVHVVGAVPADIVWDYFAAADLGIHCFTPNAQTNDATPLNVLEFGAFGKPMLATDLTELARLKLQHVRLMVHDAAAWTQGLLDDASFETPDPRRLADAMQMFSWETNSAKLAEAMQL